MTTEKTPIVVVGEDKEIINLLSFKYEIETVLTYDQYMTKLLSVRRSGKRDKIADIIIVGGKIDESQFEYPPQEEIKPDKLTNTLKNIFVNTRDVYYVPPIFIGFGTGALLLATFNRANLLYDITNHESVIHSTSFVMPDGKVLEFDVSSNHNHLILPTPRPFFDVLAFSTYNNSQSYTRADGSTFKANRDFIEIESVKFRPSNSYCFMYDVPQPEETVLTDLTLQLLTR